MSENKKGVRIREDEEAISILANDGFSESKKCLDEIFAVLNDKKDKRLRIHLSPKGKSFPDTFNKIRRTVMEKEWEDADIRVHTRSQFRQLISYNGDKRINTPSYDVYRRDDTLAVVLSSQRTIFANDPYSKELAFLIGREQPAILNVYFSRGIQEKKPEDFQNRIRALHDFFVRYIKDIYSIEKASFYEGSQKDLLAMHVRFPDNDVLFEVDKEELQASEDVPPVLPVFKTKHVRPGKNKAAEDEKENKKE